MQKEREENRGLSALCRDTCVKYRVYIAYILTGLLTTLIGVVSFHLLVRALGDYKTANFLSLVITKLSAYVANKFWVFHSKTDTIKSFGAEFMRFFVARFGVAILDYILLILFVDFFGFDVYYSKYFIMVLVVIVNYFSSKYYVYLEKK